MKRPRKPRPVSVACGDRRVVKDLFNLSPAEQAELQQLLSGRKSLVRAILGGQSCTGEGSKEGRAKERTTSLVQGGSPSAEDRSS